MKRSSVWRLAGSGSRREHQGAAASCIWRAPSRIPRGHQISTAASGPGAQSTRWRGTWTRAASRTEA
eukprot:3524562-Prymnesium_polylepis.3